MNWRGLEALGKCNWTSKNQDRRLEAETCIWNYIAVFSPPRYFTVGEQPPDVFRSGTASNRLFRAFVKELVSRYQNETTILMWEIGNELNLLVEPRTTYIA